MRRHRADANGNGFKSARPILKALALFTALIAVLAVIYRSPLHAYLDQLRRLPELTAKAGPLAPVAFSLAVALLVAVGVPRLLLCPIGGVAFGFLWGLLLTQLGTLAGYYLVFLFVRWGGQNFAREHVARFTRFTALIQRQGIAAVFVMRQVPIHGTICNLLIGLSPVRHRDFLIGTTLGLFPEAIPCTLIGTGALQSSFSKSAGYLTAAVVALLVVWLGIGLWLRSGRKGSGPVGVDGVARNMIRED